MSGTGSIRVSARQVPAEPPADVAIPPRYQELLVELREAGERDDLALRAYEALNKTISTNKLLRRRLRRLEPEKGRRSV